MSWSLPQTLILLAAGLLLVWQWGPALWAKFKPSPAEPVDEGVGLLNQFINHCATHHDADEAKKLIDLALDLRKACEAHHA